MAAVQVIPPEAPGFAIEAEAGQTALDPDEARGLRWGERSARRQPVLKQDFLRELHKRLFGQVWSWAGRYRESERNIGVAPHAITTELHKLFADAATWDAFDSVPCDERGVRLHHRLTWIHPFPNGNGRCARIFTDLYLTQCGTVPFTWGMHMPADQQRSSYLAAVRAADTHDYAPLLAMVRR